jgi:MFS family permease
MAVAATLAMLAVLTLSSMAVFTATVLAPEAGPALGIDPARIGLFISLVYVVAMFTGAVTGTLVLRWGGIRVCQLSMISASAGLAALSLGTLPATVLSALLLGLSYGPFNPASAHVLAGISTPRWRPLVFSVKQTGVPLGGALAGIIVPLLVLTEGWRGAAAWIAVAPLVVGLAIEPLRRGLDLDRQPGERLRLASLVSPIHLALGDRVLRRLTIGAFFYAGCQLCVGAFLVVYLIWRLDMGLVEAGGVFALLQIGGFLGRLFWGAVATRASGSRVVLVGIGLLTATSLVGAILLGPGWPMPAVMGLALLLGLSSFGWNGVMLSEIASLAPPGRATDATAGMQFVMFGGVVVIPPAFGGLVELLGRYDAAFAAAATFALAGAWLIRSARPGSPG